MSANLTRSPSGPATWPLWPPSHRPPPSNGVSFAGGARCVRSTALRPPDPTGTAHCRPEPQTVEQKRQPIHALAGDRRDDGRLRWPPRTASGAAWGGGDRHHLEPGQSAAEIPRPARPAAAPSLRSTAADQYAWQLFVPVGPLRIGLRVRDRGRYGASADGPSHPAAGRRCRLLAGAPAGPLSL